MSEQLPPFAVYIHHEVEDYDIWKKAFDTHAITREEASIVGAHINRGIDNPHWVSVYIQGTDRPKVEAFLQSADLRETMKHAGVTSQPHITFIKPVERVNVDLGPGKFGAVISHTVADYDTWKTAFDANDDHRKAAGTTGYGLNTGLDDDRLIVVYLQCDSPGGLKKLFASEDLKAKMKEAGVTSVPEIVFIKSQA